jgi:A/G-specific adenine glycosylase
VGRCARVFFCVLAYFRAALYLEGMSKALQSRLLDWYDRHRRVMPWRAQKGKRPDPYHVWLSEIMLQQTTVAAVGPYFEKFVRRWPNVKKLAAADLDEVLAEWAGLGYYARARNLHKCAKALDEKDKFPETVEELLELPGIGPYTAAAISSIAFDRPAVAVDGNVERVASRFFAVEEPSKKLLAEKAAELAKGNPRPGDFTQAFMELGATVCTPKSPKCGQCPWKGSCAAFRQDRVAEFPRKAEKKAKPVRHGRVFWLRRANGDFCIVKREARGLYGGMYQLPTTDWTPDGAKTAGAALIKKLKLSPQGATVQHSFTHFDLVLEIWGGRVNLTNPVKNAVWISASDMGRYALPSLMKKTIRLCLDAGSL